MLPTPCEVVTVWRRQDRRCASPPIWASEVTGLIERRWGRDYRCFAAIVVVGGGALPLREALLTRFGGKAFLPDDPVIATARGLFKMALMQAARKRAWPARDGAEEVADG